MGMPRIENTPIDRNCALTALLQSIALQEAALAHILNAEGEKIQRVVCDATCVDQLLDVNESVLNTVQAVSTLEESLRQKTNDVLDALGQGKCHHNCHKCC